MSSPAQRLSPPVLIPKSGTFIDTEPQSNHPVQTANKPSSSPKSPVFIVHNEPRVPRHHFGDKGRHAAYPVTILTRQTYHSGQLPTQLRRQVVVEGKGKETEGAVSDGSGSGSGSSDANDQGENRQKQSRPLVPLGRGRGGAITERASTGVSASSQRSESNSDASSVSKQTKTETDLKESGPSFVAGASAMTQKNRRPRSKDLIFDDLYRTELCGSVLGGKQCAFEMCTFSHTVEEIRPRPWKKTYKTVECYDFQNGSCRLGHRCHYIHDEQQLMGCDARVLVSLEDNCARIYVQPPNGEKKHDHERLLILTIPLCALDWVLPGTGSLFEQQFELPLPGWGDGPLPSEPYMGCINTVHVGGRGNAEARMEMPQLEGASSSSAYFETSCDAGVASRSKEPMIQMQSEQPQPLQVQNSNSESVHFTSQQLQSSNQPPVPQATLHPMTSYQPTAMSYNGQAAAPSSGPNVPNGGNNFFTPSQPGVANPNFFSVGFCGRCSCPLVLLRHQETGHLQAVCAQSNCSLGFPAATSFAATFVPSQVTAPAGVFSPSSSAFPPPSAAFSPPPMGPPPISTPSGPTTAHIPAIKTSISFAASVGMEGSGAGASRPSAPIVTPSEFPLAQRSNVATGKATGQQRSPAQAKKKKHRYVKMDGQKRFVPNLRPHS